jgi:hypothetical protein
MFLASLRPSSGGQTEFSLPMVFCPVVTVLMLESRLASCVHCVEYVASNLLHTVWPPEDGRKDARNMLRNNWLPTKSLNVASSWSHLYLQNILLVMFCFNSATFRKLSDKWGKNESGLSLLPPWEPPKTARDLIQQCGHAVSWFLYWYWYYELLGLLSTERASIRRFNQNTVHSGHHIACFGRDSNKVLRVSRLSRKPHVIA